MVDRQLYIYTRASSLDGMFIQITRKKRNYIISKLDLLRYPGQHEAFDITGAVEKGLTIAGVSNSILDKNNKHKLKLDFSDYHRMSFPKVVTVVDKKVNDEIWTDPNGNIV